MSRDFSGALSVDFIQYTVIDSIINLVLAVPSYSRVARPSYFHIGPL